ncbi:MAG: glutamine--tRNA ligase/YqeY domain fusion protein [Methylotenera sp.]|nr:glutamine--tRNA ligase/YqeY domain fusion protein [Methylotenera sp.]MDO9233805.1 glutamine--tRNA ligase/YqeY domain fusion protein [Methylotenera sp.]MDO9389036.1 glutamine--tRNA ligase/YqeY domain fusion protein [Methylotenera sp.]MDP2102068.1 glutamine--tRNA ligase/YqeY domain fusion protein [Methylotenera sp.]MDP2281793.1 glutamine--tRNA ligase/YqeY domain fusion protein [Methylotenera sp.]
MSSEKTPTPAASNFIRAIIEKDLAQNKFVSRKWAGKPGDASEHAKGEADPAKIRTRFPPEPNGYLHIGHAKSICLNFGLARDYNGICHLRFDDTNPEKESQEYVDSITDMVQWLGFNWQNGNEKNLYFASNYFDYMYHAAEMLIQQGLAYVDEQTPDEMRANRGSLTEPGKDSPYRNRGIEENLTMFREMRDGKHSDGSMVLRAKIDMASPNINMRDPAIYRVRRAHHHNTGDKWCIYPMYTFAHPIEDALEQITHSICTLEFEDQRPFYDWLLERLAEAGLLAHPLPKQYEFARLNLTYVVLSKRKLIQLVEEKHVSGWDDPRLPTLAGARRRGYTPEGFKLFTDRIGVSKADSWIEYTILEDCMREVLNLQAERRIAVLDPIKLVIDNYPEAQSEDCFAPNHPLKPELGKRVVPLTRELWIEREDFMEVPSKGYFRLFPDNMVRLRYGYVVKCTGCEKDAQGNVTVVHCDYLPDTKSGTPGSDSVKVKGNIHWVSAQHAYECEVRLYDRLFKEAHAGEGDRDFLEDINPNSVTLIAAQLEPSLKDAKAEDSFQFERHGYFVADRKDSVMGKPVFNRTVTLKDAWQK